MALLVTFMVSPLAVLLLLVRLVVNSARLRPGPSRARRWWLLLTVIACVATAVDDLLDFVRIFAAVASVAPPDKSAMLAAGIAETMNRSALRTVIVLGPLAAVGSALWLRGRSPKQDAIPEETGRP